MSKKGQQSSKKAIIIVSAVAVVIIAVLVGVIISLVSNKQRIPQEAQKEKRNVVVNEKNVEEVIKEMEEEEDSRVPMYYEAKMNAIWYFSDGAAVSDNAYVENVTENANDVYFDVVRTDTKETIYESPLLVPGSYVDSISLETELEEGEYECELIYYLVDEEQTVLSTVRFALTIVVQS